MIRVHNGDQLVIPHHQSPRLHLCSIFLLDDVFPVANPCSLAEEWPVHAFFSRCLKQPPDVFRDCFRKCVEMGDLSECYVFQLVGATLVVMPVMVQVPLVPHLEPLGEEVIDHCGCPIQGAVLCGGFVADVISLSVDPLLGDPTFEQVNPTYGLLGCR